MKFKFSFGAVLALALFASANVFALTCKNDYSSASGCAENTNAAGDCSTLGYTKTIRQTAHIIFIARLIAVTKDVLTVMPNMYYKMILV